MSFPAYEEYKETGVELVGKAPTHWEVWKIAHSFTQIGSGTTPKSDKAEYYDDGSIPWVNTGDLDDGPLHGCAKSVTEKAIEDHSTLKLYPVGSLLFAMYGATIGKLGILQFAATVNQACCVFSGDSPIKVKFLFYWFLGLRQKILSLATGGGQPNVSQDILRTLKVACPNEEEQRTIASFLDTETSKIDSLVDQQRRLIELLKEKRQAVISHAVTKGLDPSVPMKDSGIERLGEVPEHWTLTRVGFVASVARGTGYQNVTEVDEDDNAIRMIRISDFNDFDPIWVRNSETLNPYIVDSTDLLIAGTGASAGITMRITDGMVGIIHSYNAPRIRCLNIVPEFLFFVLNSQGILQQEDLLFTGSAQHFLDLDAISKLEFPVCGEDEQHEIVSYVRERLGKLDSLEAEAERAIELLQERRTALISAAVTGKIDVREFAYQETA